MNKSDILGDFWKQVEAGLIGENKGLPIGFPRLSEYICNLQKSTYYLIGGNTGSGKTAFVDNAFLFTPYDYLQSNPDLDTKLEIIYYSLEIDPVIKLAKFACRKVYEDYGIKTDVKNIFSKGSSDLDKETYRILKDYNEYFQSLIGKSLFFRTSVSPMFLHSDLMTYYEKKGTVIRSKPEKEGDRGIILDYKPNDPKVHTIVIVDHIGLIDKNKQHNTKKDAIDDMSRLLVFFRNMFKTTVVVVSQFNRSLEGMDRRDSFLEPQLADFKDSGGTQEDANIVFALFYPYRFGIDTYRGYPINKLTNLFRACHILKNRDGEDNLMVGMHFLGAIGRFKELPSAKTIMETPDLLNKILKTKF